MARSGRSRSRRMIIWNAGKLSIQWPRLHSGYRSGLGLFANEQAHQGYVIRRRRTTELTRISLERQVSSADHPESLIAGSESAFVNSARPGSSAVVATRFLRAILDVLDGYLDCCERSPEHLICALAFEADVADGGTFPVRGWIDGRSALYIFLRSPILPRINSALMRPGTPQIPTRKSLVGNSPTARSIQDCRRLQDSAFDARSCVPEGQRLGQVHCPRL